MVGDLLRGFELAAVLHVSRDAGGAKGVIADFRFDAGRARAPLNHAVAVLLPHRIAGEDAGAAAAGRSE